jgi:hypothetical protein
MNYATIEIYSRTIDGFKDLPLIPKKNMPQHMFILITDSQGKQTIIRGGPERDSMLLGNLKVIQMPYIEENKHFFQNDHFKAKDLLELPSAMLWIGPQDDELFEERLDVMSWRIDEINRSRYDYKLPIPGCTLSICHTQNSNTVIKDIVTSAGLEFQLPQYKDGTPIVAPGIDFALDHTIMDQMMKEMLVKYAQEHQGEVPVNHPPVFESFDDFWSKVEDLERSRPFREEFERDFAAAEAMARDKKEDIANEFHRVWEQAERMQASRAEDAADFEAFFEKVQKAQPSPEEQERYFAQFYDQVQQHSYKTMPVWDEEDYA